MGFADVLRPVASQLIALFGDGETATFRRYTQVRDPVKGTSSRTLAETVTAQVVIVEENVFHLEGWSYGDRLMIIDAQNFTGAELDESWTIETSDPETTLGGPVTVVRPGTSAVYFQILLKRGAHGR